MSSEDVNLKAYLDGELTSEEASRVEELLASDAELRAEAESFRKLSQSIQFHQKNIPVKGAERVLGKNQRRKFFGWPVLTAAAVSLLVVVGSLIVFRTYDQPLTESKSGVAEIESATTQALSPQAMNALPNRSGSFAEKASDSSVGMASLFVEVTSTLAKFKEAVAALGGVVVPVKNEVTDSDGFFVIPRPKESDLVAELKKVSVVNEPTNEEPLAEAIQKAPTSLSATDQAILSQCQENPSGCTGGLYKVK